MIKLKKTLFELKTIYILLKKNGFKRNGLVVGASPSNKFKKLGTYVRWSLSNAFDLG